MARWARKSRLCRMLDLAPRCWHSERALVNMIEFTAIPVIDDVADSIINFGLIDFGFKAS